MTTFDPAWEAVHRQRDWGRYPPEENVRFLARAFRGCDRAETRILDLGCGAGSTTWLLAREGFSATAFDGSFTAAIKARNRIQKEGLAPVPILQADASKLPFADESFNGIIDSAAISANTTEGINLILGECFRVLLPGGSLFSSGLFKIGMTGYATGERVEEHVFREITEGPLSHIGTIHFFDRKMIVEFLYIAGFTEISVDSLERTDLNGKVSVKYFIAQSRKPQIPNERNQK